MMFRDSSYSLLGKKFLLALTLFPCSFLFIFYFTRWLFIPGFAPQITYVLWDILLFLLPALIALLLPGWNGLYLLGVYLFLLAPTLTTTSYIAIYGHNPNWNTFFFLWETNLGEATEFIQSAINRSPGMFFFAVTSAFFPLFPLSYLLYKRKMARSISIWHRYAVVIFCLLFWVLLCTSTRSKTNLAFEFYRSFFSYQIEAAAVRDLSDTAIVRIKDIEVKSSLPEEIPETYVVVIGESASRHHWSLFGYSRETDPKMKALKEEGRLATFGNVNAIVSGTTRSLMHALSFKDQFAPLSSGFRFSVVDVFNAARFKSYWFSNNAPMIFYDNFLQLLSRNASERRFTKARDADMSSLILSSKQEKDGIIRDRAKKTSENLTFDEELLPWFDEALKSKENKKLIFLHLKGSHDVYWYRFPNSFERYRDRRGINPKPFEMTEEGIRILNDYDNSIYYTDAILRELIQRLEAEGGVSWLLYFSDHGEDVFDLRQGFGRDAQNLNRYMLDVPLVAWFSGDYSKIRDTKIMAQYRERPYDLDSLIYAIMDLANIKTELLDKTRSIFSDKYKVPARMIGTRPYIDMISSDKHAPKIHHR